MRYNLLKGNNMEKLKMVPDNSIDSVVTDPPYGINFMGKKWDYDVPSVEFWKEVMRVLKPGGHVLSFCGTRTYHRMAVNIEDAGFEIRDQIDWVYGSGFPKSYNIGKAVDKLEGNEREVVEVRIPGQPGLSSGSNIHNNSGYNLGSIEPVEITKGTSEYEGWGTALKPAHENICLARKPLSEKTVAENVLKWKTGGINVDGCRIGHNEDICRNITNSKNEIYGKRDLVGSFDDKSNELGRFPANIIFDEEAGKMLDEQSGFSKSSKFPEGYKRGFSNSGSNIYGDSKGVYEETGYTDEGGASRFFMNIKTNENVEKRIETNTMNTTENIGQNISFRYVPKVSKKERNLGCEDLKEKEWINYQDGPNAKEAGIGTTSGISHNNHPTIKPIKLMSYLCRLITPKNGIVLDPFTGSGSTGIAALLEGFRFCGIEMNEEYFKIAEARITAYEKYKNI